MARTRLEWAQWMGARGFGVFVVTPGTKNPLHGRSWYSHQSQDPEEIEKMLAVEADCNYGVYPGEKYVIIDLDIKPEVNGVDVFSEICEEHGEFLEELKRTTLCTETPGGGVHLYFKSPYPAGIANDFPDGIDVRGVNGYCVGPGSQDSRGEWKLVDPDKDIAPLPDFLEQYVMPPGTRDPKNKELVPGIEWDMGDNIRHALNWLHDRDPAIEGQHGDQWTLETIYFLRDFGLGEEKIHWAINQGWNQKCEPPWGDAELDVKIRNAFLYPQNRPGCKSPAYRAHLVFKGAGGGQWAQYLTPEAKAELFRPSHNLKLVVDNTPGADQIPGGVEDDEIDPVTGEPAQTFPWFEWGAFKERGAQRKYVIYNTLLAHGITHMLAKRGTGKSTIALDMAAHIACDMDWAGQATQTGWKVIYICGEDDVGMEVNVNAWAKKYGVDPDPGRFLIAADVIKLTDDQRLDIRIREMMEWAKGAPCVVFLDTWQRSTMGWGKNDQEAMESAVGRAERIAKHLCGPLVSLVHPPKDGRMTVKGAGEQEDASAGIYHLEEVTNGIRFEIERIKGPGRGTWFIFEKDFVDLEVQDDFGKNVIGLAVSKVAGQVGEAKTGLDGDAHERAWAKAIHGISKAGINSSILEAAGLDANQFSKGIKVSHVAEFLDVVAKHHDGDDGDPIEWECRDYVREWLDELIVHLANRSPKSLNSSAVTRTLGQLFTGNQVPHDRIVPLHYDTAIMMYCKPPPGQKKRAFFFGEKKKLE